MDIRIPQPAAGLIDRLQAAGYEAYAVGGCIRDALLGRQPQDWDITTSAKPEQVKALFRRTIDTGIQHGTVTVMIGKVGYEITTYRLDGVYEDGRHPKQVTFTASLREDLKRRDFTINALACNEQDGLVDFFGGVEDLENGIIRCVGDPAERFAEDALRMLRALRFSAQLGFSIEPGTMAALVRLAPNLERVSRERTAAELTKLLCSDRPELVRMVFETGISAYVCPSFEKLAGRSARIPAALPAEKYIRWAALLRAGREGPDAALAVRILKELKFDNRTIGRVRTLVEWTGKGLAAFSCDPAGGAQGAGGSCQAQAPVFVRGGAQGKFSGAAVRRAMGCMEPGVWDALLILNGWEAELAGLTAQIRQRGDCLSLADLAVKGADLAAAGMRPGRYMGRTLNAMLEYVLEHPACNEKEYLLARFAGGGAGASPDHPA